ncbi:hypothetical protein LTR28_009915 [Elasticomyces elasticus]|nr:hypothetical protein LTR28_009915 [Elasticomyces elasticus]
MSEQRSITVDGQRVPEVETAQPLIRIVSRRAMGDKPLVRKIFAANGLHLSAVGEEAKTIRPSQQRNASKNGLIRMLGSLPKHKQQQQQQQQPVPQYTNAVSPSPMETTHHQEGHQYDLETASRRCLITRIKTRDLAPIRRHNANVLGPNERVAMLKTQLEQPSLGKRHRAMILQQISDMVEKQMSIPSKPRLEGNFPAKDPKKTQRRAEQARRALSLHSVVRKTVNARTPLVRKLDLADGYREASIRKLPHGSLLVRKHPTTTADKVARPMERRRTEVPRRVRRAEFMRAQADKLRAKHGRSKLKIKYFELHPNEPTHALRSLEEKEPTIHYHGSDRPERQKDLAVDRVRTRRERRQRLFDEARAGASERVPVRKAQSMNSRDEALEESVRALLRGM